MENVTRIGYSTEEGQSLFANASSKFMSELPVANSDGVEVLEFLRATISGWLSDIKSENAVFGLFRVGWTFEAGYFPVSRNVMHVSNTSIILKLFKHCSCSSIVAI